MLSGMQPRKHGKGAAHSSFGVLHAFVHIQNTLFVCQFLRQSETLSSDRLGNEMFNCDATLLDGDERETQPTFLILL